MRALRSQPHLLRLGPVLRRMTDPEFHELCRVGRTWCGGHGESPPFVRTRSQGAHAESRSPLGVSAASGASPGLLTRRIA